MKKQDAPDILLDGTKRWRVNGRLHRVDGPAIEHPDGTKEWYLNGLRHREDGPAIERADGTGKYWHRGNRITKKAFLSRAFQIKIVMEE